MGVYSLFLHKQSCEVIPQFTQDNSSVEDMYARKTYRWGVISGAGAIFNILSHDSDPLGLGAINSCGNEEKEQNKRGIKLQQRSPPARQVVVLTLEKSSCGRRSTLHWPSFYAVHQRNPTLSSLHVSAGDIAFASRLVSAAVLWGVG